ncbi:MAG: hypothetical protein AAB691_04660 [Patescibacteria group bacterium]
MEREGDVETWKLLLIVQVDRRRQDPPSLAVGVDVPRVNLSTENQFGLNLLQAFGAFVGG